MSERNNATRTERLSTLTSKSTPPGISSLRTADGHVLDVVITKDESTRSYLMFAILFILLLVFVMQFVTIMMINF
jgi:hypothetical protein